MGDFQGGMGWSISPFVVFVAITAISNAAAGPLSSIHTVVSTECTDEVYFEWQVVGLSYR
jgi:glucose uptake protein GlcU